MTSENLPPEWMDEPDDNPAPADLDVVLAQRDEDERYLEDLNRDEAQRHAETEAFLRAHWNAERGL